MAASLAPVYLDNNRVFLQGEPKPRASQIVAAGGKHPDAVEVERVGSQTAASGSHVGSDDVIDRTSGTQPIYLRTVGNRGQRGRGGEGEGVPTGDVRIEGGEPVAQEVGKPGSRGGTDTPQAGIREGGGEATEGMGTSEEGTAGAFETGRNVVRGSYAMETQLQGGAAGEVEPNRPAPVHKAPHAGAQGPLTAGPGEGPSKQAPYGKGGTGGTTGAASSRQAIRQAGERFQEPGTPGEKGDLDPGTTSKSQGSYGLGSGWGTGLGEGANRTPERQERESRYREDEGAGEREAEEREIPETGAGRLGTGIAEPGLPQARGGAGGTGLRSDVQDMEAAPGGRASGRSNREYEEEHGPVRGRQGRRDEGKAGSDRAPGGRGGERGEERNAQ